MDNEKANDTQKNISFLLENQKICVLKTNNHVNHLAPHQKDANHNDGGIKDLLSYGLYFYIKYTMTNVEKEQEDQNHRGCFPFYQDNIKKIGMYILLYEDSEKNKDSDEGSKNLFQ